MVFCERDSQAARAQYLSNWMARSLLIPIALLAVLSIPATGFAQESADLSSCKVHQELFSQAERLEDVSRFYGSPDQAVRSGTSVTPAEVWRRRYSLAALLSVVATWHERIRFRWELERMARDNPHLIDDSGLTKQQAEEEIAKPFWHHTV